jgi:probable DNA metabolism protein
MKCEYCPTNKHDEFSGLMKEAIARELGEDKVSGLQQSMLDYEWRFGKPKKIDRLANFVVTASRYSSDKSLIYKVILQAMKFGADYILDKCSPEAEEFITRYRAVVREYSRLISHTRFQRFNKTLVAEVRTDFNIFDLLLRNFKSKYRKFKIVLLSRNKAHIANGGLYAISREEFLEQTKIKLDRHDKMWETYYTSQFISNRRNKKYAMNNMPKKYSPALEKHYIEFGIQDSKLTNFIF